MTTLRSIESVPAVVKSTWFESFATKTATWSGKPLAFLVAAAVLIIWAFTGPLFEFSDTWQLVINTGTSVITFLMVFLIQHTQSRDTRALQLKLDELILVTKSAHNSIIGIEEEFEIALESAKRKVRARAGGD
jgi:low affinity Fe/Cu permease